LGHGRLSELIGKIGILIVIFYLSSILIGYLVGTGIIVTYKDIIMSKPEKLSISEFQNAEAVFVSGTCYSREPFNGTMVFSEPPIVEGNINCSLNMSRGGYVCSGEGYIYVWNFTCTDTLKGDHPVSNHYYMGIPGDPVVVAIMNSYLADAAIIFAFILSVVFGSKIYLYGKTYFLTLFFSPIISYVVAYVKASEMDIMRNILRAKAVYLPIGMCVGLLVSPLVVVLSSSLKKQFKKESFSMDSF